LLSEIYFKEFLKNPFFWWSAFIGIITTWISFEPFFRIVEAILLEQLYVPILYGCVGLSLYLMIYPIKSRLRNLKLQKETKKEFLVYTFMIVAIITNTVYFSSDPAFMLTKAQSQIVSDKVILEEVGDLKLWAEYLVLPFLYAIMLAQSRKLLYGNEEMKFDNIESSWKISIIITILVGGAYLLFKLVSG